MKRILTVLSIFAMVGFVSCKKDEVATITASDVTVEEGATAKIAASTNSTATITFASADAAVATVSADGTVTGVKAGNTNVTLKVAAVKGFTAAEKTIKVTVTAKATPEPPTPQEEAIKIDGDFSDWAALAKGTFSQYYGDEEAVHPALTFCKVYATADFIYVYFEWDPEYTEDTSWVPFHCYMNLDGDASTGGYADEFADACSDFLLEGSIYDGGEICSYWAGGYPWIGEPNAEGWSWAPDTDNVFPEEAPTVGAGVEGKYEFSIDRKMFADAGYPIADVFSIGFDIQQNWNSVGVIPNAAPSEDNASGVVNSLQVTTQK